MHLSMPAGARRRTRRALLAAALPAALVATALPAAADASVVVVDDRFTPRYEYRADPGETNALAVSLTADGRMLFRDSQPIRVDEPTPTPRFPTDVCQRASTTEVICDPQLAPTNVDTGDGDDELLLQANVGMILNLGAGNDTLLAGVRRNPLAPINSITEIDFGPGTDTASYAAANFPVTVTLDGGYDDGGAGDVLDIQDVEILVGSRFGDTLFGSDARNDVIRGGAGIDVIGGGGGNDLIDEGTTPNGADFINGGNGSRDIVTYGGRIAGVNVSLDGVRNDGATGEQDDVRPSVENIIGTGFGDRLVGNSLANTIEGFGGVDTIDGRHGDDTLFGGAQADTLLGRAGFDTLLARDGVADQIDCGVDGDRAQLDSADAVSGCEQRSLVGTLQLVPKRLAAVAGNAHVG